MNDTHTAPGYDYAAQQWLTGQAGENLALSQMTEEYDLLTSERVAEWRAVCGWAGTDWPAC
jgi:hypothetical protein